MPVLKNNSNQNGDSTKNNRTGKNSNKKLISYGNCQFPTLGFVVDRFKRIKYFQSEEFWMINLSLKKGRKKFQFNWERGHLFDRLLAVCIYQDCINNQNDHVVVKSVTTRPKSRYAPYPLTTVELQKDCSRFFKYSAKDTLQIAETLYTKGFISYPRTETDSFQIRWTSNISSLCKQNPVNGEIMPECCWMNQPVNSEYHAGVPMTMKHIHRSIL